MELEVVETGTFAVETDLPIAARPPQPRGPRRSSALHPPDALHVPDPLGDPAQRRAGDERGGVRGRAGGRRPHLRARRRRAGARERARGPPGQRRRRAAGRVRDLRRRRRATRFDAAGGAGGACSSCRTSRCARREARAALPDEVPLADAVFNVAHACAARARAGAGRLGAGRARPRATACTSPAARTCTRARWSSSSGRASSARSARRSPAPARRCSSGAARADRRASSRRCARETEGWARRHARAVRAEGRATCASSTRGRTLGATASCCEPCGARPEAERRAARRRAAGSPRRGRGGGRGSRRRARPTRRRRSTGGSSCRTACRRRAPAATRRPRASATVRMSAMLNTTPSHSRSGFRPSRASSITSSACSTPCSAKYCASALSSAWSAATSALTVSRPSDGGQSMRIDVVVVVDVLERLAQRQLAAHLAGERQLGLGERQVRRDDAVVDGLACLGAPGEDVADRRLRVGRDVEVVAKVALRVEVDGQHAEAGPAEDVGQRAGRSSSCRSRPSGRGSRSSRPRRGVYEGSLGAVRLPLPDRCPRLRSPDRKDPAAARRLSSRRLLERQVSLGEISGAVSTKCRR